jgi:drug/metabolite transporter (DMT)-like permease
VQRFRTTAATDRKIVHLLAAAVIVSNSTGNVLLRAGLSSAGPIDSLSPAAYLAALGNLWVIAGIVLLAVWLLLQLSLLSWADLTYVLPVTSVSYVLVAILGALALHEHVSVAHWCGVLLILFGVLIVWRTRPLSAGSSRL